MSNLTGLLLLLVSSYGSSDDGFERYIQRVKSTKAKPIAVVTSKLQPIAPFIFPRDDSRRNPFQWVKKKPSQSDNQHPKQPLEAFPLDILQFVGTLQKDHSLRALISQPGGMVTLVTVGDYLGENSGQIIQINDHEIKIEQSVYGSGKWEKKIVTLDLRMPQIGEQHA